MNKSQRTEAFFAVLMKNGHFFVQFVYFHRQKRAIRKEFLEGYHTYKSKKM